MYGEREGGELILCLALLSKFVTMTVLQLFLFAFSFHIFIGNYKWSLNKGLGKSQHGPFSPSNSEMLDTQRLNRIMLTS